MHEWHIRKTFHKYAAKLTTTSCISLMMTTCTFTMSTALPMTLTKTKFAEGLNNMIEEFSLIDIWRVRHFDTYGFSYSQGNNKIKSRLDYWFISEHMQYSVTNVNIKPAIKTDHCLVAFKMIINKQNKRGRGFWKFNSSYLGIWNLCQSVKILLIPRLISSKQMKIKILIGN